MTLSHLSKRAAPAYVATCTKCKNELADRVHRGFFVKNLLFWLHIRKYKCYKCKRGQYVWVK